MGGRYTRRRMLQYSAAGTIAALTGCLGGDDGDGDGSDGETGSGEGETGSDDSGSTADADGADGADGDASDGDSTDDRFAANRPDDWPDDPTFVPNPDAGGPGGDVTLAMEFHIRDWGDADAFETLEVDFEEIVLHDDAGDTVTVPVDRTVDFMAYELETDIVLVFDAAIPAGTYTQVDYEMAGSEIVHEEHGDVTADFSDPPVADMSGDGREMEPGSQWLLQSTLHAENGYGASLEESLAVGSYSGPGDMSDPSYFEE